ncbi:unnamed protein product [Prunus armeniaca]|uniref:Aspartate/glutamate/uridylate kinase domain-containing protein n=1 Tax=Prunus armeniaca TaxID=36596 RepID=A0A6J5WGN1_PRUAR|nr:unnamed protein product [Prunus armeniaca]CAB4298504.1 unnamed protein product [Prunus armeniaca]
MPSLAPFGVTMNGNCLSGTSYKWQRVLLKVSGEALAGDHTQNIDPKVTMEIASEVASVTRLGIEVAIVVGGEISSMDLPGLEAAVWTDHLLITLVVFSHVYNLQCDWVITYLKLVHFMYCGLGII